MGVNYTNYDGAGNQAQQTDQINTAISNGANLLIVSVGFHDGGTAPIFVMSELNRASFFVDPVPQALTLTSIVIGACTTAMALSLVMMAKKQYGTITTDQIRRLNG